MVKSQIDATIFYRHSIEEVAELSTAIIPMADHIKAVGSSSVRSRMRHILNCDYFRVREARSMVTMLLNACKHAKMHLSDYFPLMRAEILDNALTLEETVNDYWAAFQRARQDAIPTN